MVSLCTTLKPLSPFSPFVKQGNLNYTSALITYRTSNSANSFLPKRGGTVAVHDAPDQVESSCRIPLTEVVAVRKKSAFWERSWSSRDVRNVVVLGGVHLLSLSLHYTSVGRLLGFLFASISPLGCAYRLVLS